MSLRQDSQESNAPSFPTLENDIGGVVANARISFALTTVERTAARGEWANAIGALTKLADRLRAHAVPDGAWRELLLAAAWYAVQASNVELVSALFEDYADRGWPADSPASMPWELDVVFEEADRRGRYDAGGALGELLEALYPSCPLGCFAVAHFRDRKLHIEGRGNDAAAIADKFARAARLADTLEMTGTQTRAKLRRGALLLRSGVSRETGRTVLRDIDHTELSRSEALWYAVGMVHSPFWLDRVRAADAVAAWAEADTAPRPDVVLAAGYLLDCAPIELQPLEVDRLEGIADELDINAAGLELRAHLEGIASAPVSRAGEAADIIAQSLGDDATEKQRAATAFTRTVAALCDETRTDGLDAEAVSRIQPFYPTAARVLEALEATIARDARTLATNLGQLEGDFRKQRRQRPAHEAKPIALLWPRLLPFVRDLRGDEDIDPTTQKRVVASTQEIVTRWLPNAPTPGYGWWAFAANLLACELHEAAAVATRRALDDGESVDDELEQRVIAAVLDRAVRGGDAAEMLEWLEVAEARLS